MFTNWNNMISRKCFNVLYVPAYTEETKRGLSQCISEHRTVICTENMKSFCAAQALSGILYILNAQTKGTLC